MICAVFLASGRSTRFAGGNKLLYEVEGVPMAERAFRTLPPDIPGLVVTPWGPVAALAQKYENLSVIGNPGGERDVALTIRRGIEALPENAEGALFCVCDQPWLTRKSVEKLVEAFREDPTKICVLSYGERSGNPCLFPRAFFPALAALPFDRGGKEVVRRNMGQVRYVPALSGRELEDVDIKPL